MARCLAAGLGVLVLAGCATEKIDWGARLGTYTYDQAVQEMGPPDKYAKLSDSTVVAEWIRRHGYYSGYAPFAYGYGPYCYGPAYGGYYTTYRSPDYVLRLTFDPEGRLKAWSHLYR